MSAIPFSIRAVNRSASILTLASTCSTAQPLQIQFRVASNTSAEPITAGTFTQGCAALMNLSIPSESAIIECTVNNTATNQTYLLYDPPQAEIYFRTVETLRLYALFNHCNAQIIDTSGIAHADGGEQLGPCRSSRATAIPHIAFFEVYNTFYRQCPSTVNFSADLASARFDKFATMAAMALVAVYRVLIWLYPSQTSRLSTAMDLQVKGYRATAAPIFQHNGTFVANTLIARRSADNSSLPDLVFNVTYIMNNPANIAEWRPAPNASSAVAMGSQWMKVTPFVIPSPTFVTLPNPPALSSVEFAMNFNEVASVGGDGITTPTVRSAQETETGVFWAYDGTPTLCAPPRLYNQFAKVVLATNGVPIAQFIRTMCVINIAMADAAIACWEEKYRIRLARPATLIRDATDPKTVAITNFVPYGAPNSNSPNPNFTPPFPAYPSGHATFGSAICTILKQVLPNCVPFTFVSDEYNGITRNSSSGAPRAYLPRTYHTLDDAIEENGQSRMFLGIHWSCDKTSGITMGETIGAYVNANAYVA